MTAEDNAAVKRPAGADGAEQPLSELKRLGKYQIEKKIGAGGMGAVFLARDVELKRTVALKVLPRDKAQNPILVRRFRAEAQAAAQLRHTNIVAVYDSGEADGFLYIAMEYVEGYDLFELVSRRGTVPTRRSIDIVRQVASALQHAYEQNIVHRDIKPSNLLIRRDGTVKLTDLGLARSIDDTLETNITRAGTTVGTVDYMAPEQARNSKLADIRSDLYSLGCTWYQMLTGSPPYPDGSVTNKLQAHAIKPIPDPRDKNPQVPEGLTAVLRRMMAKKPDDRYQTPAELIDDLDHAKLTNAAISREIFSDLNDDEDGASPPVEDDDDELSGDSYFDIGGRTVQPAEEEEVAPSHAAPRKKANRSTVDEQQEETHSVTRSKSRPAPKEEPEEESPVYYKSKPKPAKPGRDEPEVENKSHRSTRPVEPEDEEEDAEPDRVTGKTKPRAAKPEAPEAHRPSTKPAEKAVDSKSTKPKTPGQKTLPPKRQPLPEDTGEKKPLFSKDLVRNVALVGGVVFVIVGIGVLISGYGSNVEIDKNPFGSPETVVAPPVQPAQIKSTQSPEQGSPEATTVNIVGGNTNTNTTKPDSAVPVYDVDKIPDWANREADLTGLQVLTVGAATKSSTSFATLEEALKAVPSEGAVIKLQGAGPFPLPLVEIAQRKRIVIASNTAQDRPVIAFKPADGQTNAGLKVTEGTLELRGVHFSLDRAAITGPFKGIEVVDGQLKVQACSFTASGTSADSAFAMVLFSTNDSASVPRMEPNLLIDRVLVRGDGLGAVSIRRANIDAVIRDSLLVTGSAPAVEMSGHLAAALTDIAVTKPRRILRFQRCTLSSQNRIFDVSVDEAGKPPQTAVSLRDVLCAAQGIVPNSAIIFAGRWPQIRSNESWLTRMTWTSTNTLYLGFEQLIDLGSSFKVVDAATWQRVWSTRTDSKQFQKISFPETAIDDLNVTLPQEFDTSGLSFREVKATDGSMPGCPIGKLIVPDVSSSQRAVAFTTRPALPPAAVKPPDPVQIRKVDLKKEDLGLILNKGDWQSGTMFEASGGGICFMTPVKIEGKSVRIVIRQTDGANVKLQPIQPKGGESVKNVPPALISIARGSLEMTNAVLEGYANPKGMTPEWLIQGTDATVILNGCRLLGSENDGTRHVGLIRWTAGVPSGAAAEVPALVIRDSYLASTGCGLRAECGQGSLIIRNSVFAVRGDAVDLRPIRANNALLPVFDAENVTFSATNAAVRFEAAPGMDAVTSPWRLFVERCVFAPPLAFKAGESANATVLQCVGPVIEQRQIEWWGASNGIAKQILFLVRRDGDSGTGSEERTGLTAWRKLWDKGSTIRMLTGDKGVYLTGELPPRWKDLKPASFELHKGSQAATWGEGGRPIGANTQAVEESTLAKKGADSTKPSTPPNVSTKKNLGF